MVHPGINPQNPLDIVGILTDNGVASHKIIIAFIAAPTLKKLAFFLKTDE